MKNIIKDIAMVIILFVIVPCFVGTIETHYNREGTVIAIQGQEVIVEDTTKNVWAFNGDGFLEGDRVKLKMFNNCTDFTINDDQIEKVKIIY